MITIQDCLNLKLIDGEKMSLSGVFARFALVNPQF
jgi:hypothetical protein